MTDFQAWSCSLPSLPYTSCPPAGMYSHTVDVLEGRLVVCHSLSCLQLTPQGWQARGDTTMKINPTLILWGNSKGRQFPVGRTKRRRRTEPQQHLNITLYGSGKHSLQQSQHPLIWKWQAGQGGGGLPEPLPELPMGRGWETSSSNDGLWKGVEEREEVAGKKEQYIRNQSASQKSVTGLVDYCKELCQPGLALPARRESKNTHSLHCSVTATAG